MNTFSAHHNSIASADAFTPRNGMLVAARFSHDGQWYRARVRRCSDVLKTAEVIFIDYGNEETVSYKDIRDDKFKTMPPQAISAKLRWVLICSFLISNATPKVSLTCFQLITSTDKSRSIDSKSYVSAATSSLRWTLKTPTVLSICVFWIHLIQIPPFLRSTASTLISSLTDSL